VKSSIVEERQCIMAISPLAGKPAPTEMLADMNRLQGEYYERSPDLGDPNQLVSSA
jgi:phosphoglucomutase